MALYLAVQWPLQLGDASFGGSIGISITITAMLFLPPSQMALDSVYNIYGQGCGKVYHYPCSFLSTARLCGLHLCPLSLASIFINFSFPVFNFILVLSIVVLLYLYYCCSLSVLSVVV